MYVAVCVGVRAMDMVARDNNVDEDPKTGADKYTGAQQKVRLRSLLTQT
jgi:hypothetical protein